MRLSKSKLMAARQCLKRIHLEIHQPELARYSPAAQQAFDNGHAVGALAREIYGTDQAVLIPFEGGLAHALRKTRRLVDREPRTPLFEATFEYGGILVRADALLPESGGWRLVEVKASTHVEPHYAFDCAVQAWVIRGLGYPLTRVHLAHVDNRFVYAGDRNFEGYLREVDVGAETDRLAELVPRERRAATLAVAGPEPDVPVGAHCFKPYECPYVHHCWPQRAEHSLLNLPRADKAKLGQFIADGHTDLRDVPAERLTETQRRVQRIATRGRAEILPDAGEFIRALPYPRYYLDFESIGPAIPVFAGMRPYRALPFQWSCHYEPAPDCLEHAEFLDVTGVVPFRRLAESLIRCVGKSGPILTYSPYENTMITRLAGLFPDLADTLAGIAARLVDLKPIVETSYYAPEMRGSWSIKALLPSIAPDMDYSQLEGIQEGMGASSSYLEAIDEATPASRRRQIEAQLRRYCEFDTLALVRVARFFAAH